MAVIALHCDRYCDRRRFNRDHIGIGFWRLQYFLRRVGWIGMIDTARLNARLGMDDLPTGERIRIAVGMLGVRRHRAAQ